MTKHAIQLSLLIIICLFIFTGCNRARYENSEMINERVLVSSAVFSASHTEQSISTMPVGLAVKIGKDLYLINTYIPDKYEVVLECEFGEVYLEEKEFYDIAKDQVGEYVDITYCLKYRIVYDSKTNAVKSRELQNYVIKSISLISE